MLTLLLLALSLAAPAEIPDLEAPEVSVTIQPSSMDAYQLLRRQTPDTYTCQALVTEAGTHRLYVAAQLTALAGHTEKVTRQAGDYSLEFAVKMGKAQADTTVTVKRGDKVLTRQRSTVYLKPMQDDGIIPVH